MIAYISPLFSTKNRLSALLIKVKACEKRNRERESLLVFLAYQILRICQAIDFSPQFLLMLIGLDKLEGKSKGY
jgi:hypothetical protein